MAPEQQAVYVEQVEKLIRQLQTVIGARVVVNEWGGIEEIHVLATDERNPKAIVRDVQSALAARWGLVIDYRKVSVAQQRLPRQPQEFRLAIDSLHVETDLLRGTVNVSIVLGHHPERRFDSPPDPSLRGVGTFMGQASGSHSAAGMIRVAAEATVLALNQAVEEEARFVLEDIRETEIGNHQCLLVALTLISSRYHESLVGAALINEDRINAGARATLSAANRRLAAVRKGLRHGRVASQREEALEYMAWRDANERYQASLEQVAAGEEQAASETSEVVVEHRIHQRGIDDGSASGQR